MRSLTEPFNAAPFDPQAHTWDGWRTAPPAAYYGSAAQAKDVNSVWATTGDDQTYTGSYPKLIPDQKPPGNCWSDFDPNLAGVTDGNVRIGMIPTQIFPYPEIEADPPAGGNLQ
jgi:hypothetical protein